ncbi:STAS/SEC14 domain-containing protein [Virgibacillus oceani]
MIKILPSRNPETVHVEINGKLTSEDAEKVDVHVEDLYGDDGQFNILAVFKELDGTTLQSLLKGMKVDMKRWNQMNKFAVVSEKDWVENASKTGKILPGITVAYFEMDEVEKAWKWLEK